MFARDRSRLRTHFSNSFVPFLGIKGAGPPRVIAHPGLPQIQTGEFPQLSRHVIASTSVGFDALMVSRFSGLTPLRGPRPRARNAAPAFLPGVQAGLFRLFIGTTRRSASPRSLPPRFIAFARAPNDWREHGSFL